METKLPPTSPTCDKSDLSQTDEDNVSEEAKNENLLKSDDSVDLGELKELSFDGTTSSSPELMSLTSSPEGKPPR
jgi:hypothetical protein